MLPPDRFDAGIIIASEGGVNHFHLIAAQIRKPHCLLHQTLNLGDLFIAERDLFNLTFFISDVAKVNNNRR